VNPRVYDKQKLSGPNGNLAVTGPTDKWEPDELEAVITFVVTQPKGQPVSIGIGRTDVLTRKQNGVSFDWNAAVKLVTGPAFRTGGAAVRAWASVAETRSRRLQLRRRYHDLLVPDHPEERGRPLRNVAPPADARPVGE
jgi:hypothetical protein